MFSRFHLIPEHNGRTDRFAISISRVSTLTGDKNPNINPEQHNKILVHHYHDFRSETSSLHSLRASRNIYIWKYTHYGRQCSRECLRKSALHIYNIHHIQGDTTLQTMWNSLTFPDSLLHSSAALGMLSVTHIMPLLVLNTCMDTNMQLTINSFRQLFPDKIFPWLLVKSLSAVKFPDISRFSLHTSVSPQERATKMA